VLEFRSELAEHRAANGAPSDGELIDRFQPIFDRIARDAVQREQKRELAFEPVAWLREARFGALRVPREQGGSGATLPQLFRLLVHLAEADSNLPQILRAHFAFVEILLNGGDTRAKHLWLPRIASGALVGAAMSERTEATQNTVKLTREENHWILDGKKYYCTGTIYADWIAAAAMDGDQHVSVTLPATAPGVTRADDWDGFGQRLTGSGTTHFDRVRLTDENIIRRFESGKYRDDFYITAFYQLFHVAALAGISRAILRDGVAFVQGRTRAFGIPGTSSPRNDPLVQRVPAPPEKRFATTPTSRPSRRSRSRLVSHSKPRHWCLKWVAHPPRAKPGASIVTGATRALWPHTIRPSIANARWGISILTASHLVRPGPTCNSRRGSPPMPKQLHVNLFEMNCVSHIMHGMWAHPDNNRHRFNDLDFWTELAQLCEYGAFDAVFLADVVGVYDQFRDGPDTALREALQVPSNDPLLLIPAMAQVTKNLGFGATFSTTYEPPFAFARRMSTLDHLTKGRVAWNIVTSYLPNAARNFGRDDEVPHDHRYEIADEYLDVLYKLWEGSWDDDAVIQDRARRTYTDPSKVRYIHHAGEYFKVAGPHLCQPSRQRTPVLYQATGSNAGKEFAARHAEVVFTGGLTAESVRANIADMRARARNHGRDPRDIKFVAGAGIVVGKTEADVSRKLQTYRQLISVEGRLAHNQSRIDYTKYARDERLSDIIARKDPGYEQIQPRFRPDQTIGEVLDQLSSVHYGRHFVAGTPGVVADAIEKWLDEDDIDGINLVQYLSFETARDFIELVVPELRRRGRYRESYRDGETLRERLFGAGQARLPAHHFAARYRDPAVLTAPPDRLRFPLKPVQDAELSHHELRERTTLRLRKTS
jgi:long-chain alkane monooxygenase